MIIIDLLMMVYYSTTEFSKVSGQLLSCAIQMISTKKSPVTQLDHETLILTENATHKWHCNYLPIPVHQTTEQCTYHELFLVHAIKSPVIFLSFVDFFCFVRCPQNCS